MALAWRDKIRATLVLNGGGGVDFARFLALTLCCHSLLNGANRSSKIQAFLDFNRARDDFNDVAYMIKVTRLVFVAF